MKELNPKRARESSRHIEWKVALAKAIGGVGWYVLMEHKCSDVVAIDSRGNVACFEVELSNRNIVPNFVRNVANGCVLHVVVAPDEKRAALYDSILAEAATKCGFKNFSVMTADGIGRDGLAELLSTVIKEQIQ